MTNEQNGAKGSGSTMDGLREELFRDLEMGPAATELERRKLLAGLDRPQRAAAPASLGWALGAGLAAVAIAVVLVGGGPREEAPVAGHKGVAFQGLTSPDEADQGDVIRVPEGAGIKLVLADRSVIWLGSRAELVLADGPEPRLELRSGRMIARVTRREAGRFEVATGHATVVVKGTTFSVQAEAERTTVRLHEGAVLLDTGAEEREVAPGEEVEVASGGRIARRLIGADDALADLMIVENTDDVDAPEIQARLEKVEPDETPRPRRRPRRARERDASAAPDAGARVAMGDPELERVRFDDTIDQDSLYWKAYREARKGRLAESRRLLEDYLERFPEGRYWKRVREILGLEEI